MITIYIYIFFGGGGWGAGKLLLLKYPTKNRGKTETRRHQTVPTNLRNLTFVNVPAFSHPFFTYTYKRYICDVFRNNIAILLCTGSCFYIIPHYIMNHFI